MSYSLLLCPINKKGIGKMNYLEIAGTLIGLLYLWFEYRASIWLWPVSVVMPAIYMVVYYQAGLYADAGISVYYLLAGGYGWWMWMRGVSEQQEKPITFAPRRQYVWLALYAGLLFAALGSWLSVCTDSNVPWWDGLTTAFSIIAMWMLAQKYVEQWLVWLGVDVVSCGLYVYKDLYFTSALYAVYALIAWFGYVKWKQLMQVEYERI